MRIDRIAVLTTVLIVAACAVRQESPNGIVIEVDAHQPEAALVAAREHCGKFDKKAVQIHASDPAPSPRMFFLDSQIVAFDCVAK